MPDLLYLAQRLPFPLNKGEKIRAYHDLKYLAQYYNIYLGCLIDDPADEPFIADIAKLCRDIHVGRVDRRIGRIACLRGLLTGDGLSVTFFRDRGLAAWVKRVAEQVQPEVAFVFSSNMVPYILNLPNRWRRAVDLVDVDSEKWRALAETATGPMRFVYRREWRTIAALEARIGRECDLAAFASEPEAALFRRLNPDCSQRVLGVSNGVDYRYFDPAADYSPAYDISRPNFVFTGTMDYLPNEDAVVWFANDILPLIRQHVPNAQFHVVGTNPSAEVRKLARRDGVSVTGRVPDVRPYIAHATACVAPIRVARGIQNKVLEAMAMARPVIVTKIALEGIDATPGTEAVVANDEADFATACCRFATTDDGDAIGRAARARIVQDYDWAATMSRYDAFFRPKNSREQAETV